MDYKVSVQEYGKRSRTTGFRRWFNGWRGARERGTVVHVHYLERRKGAQVEYWMIRLKDGKHIQHGWGTLPQRTGTLMTTFGIGVEDCIARLEEEVRRKMSAGFIQAEPPDWWCCLPGEPPATRH